MRFTITTSASAKAQLRSHVAWLQSEGSPQPFAREFRHALELLEVTPRAGVAVTGAATHTQLRRMLLRRSQLHIYYAVDDPHRTVHLLAIWHTARGEPPPL